MSERRRPFRRGRRSRPSGQQSQTPIPESYGDADPYLDTMDSTPTPSSPPADAAQLPDARDNMTSPAIPNTPSTPAPASADSNSFADSQPNGSDNGGSGAPPQSQPQSQYNPQTAGGQSLPAQMPSSSPAIAATRRVPRTISWPSEGSTSIPATLLARMSTLPGRTTTF